MGDHAYRSGRAASPRSTPTDHPTATETATRPAASQQPAGTFVRHALGVLTCEVGDAAGGWVACECGVSAVMVVGVQPVWQGSAAFGVGAVGLGVGPFVEQGAVEPLHLAIGLRPV